MKRFIVLLAAAGLLFAPAMTGAAGPVTPSPGVALPVYPKRIVSINPCADALLMQLADKRQIASVSHYSHDRRATSIPLKRALQFPATSGTAEEILAMRPDLVVAGSIVPQSTASALKRMGIPLVQLSIPQSVAESQEQIRQLAEIVGASQRGAVVNQRISNALAEARPPDTQKIPALIWRSGGLVPGGGTLPDELLRRTGFENVSNSYGLSQWDILPLEHLVARPPRLLFSNASEMESDRKDRMLSHPVLQKLAGRIMIADYPARLMHCAGPTLIEAANTLSAARRKLKAGK